MTPSTTVTGRNRTKASQLAMDASDHYEAFLRLYTPAQLRLMAYIRALIHNRIEADDVFQETSLILWRRFGEFKQDADFLQWALGISRRQVLKFWRTVRRDRQIFSDQFLEQLSVEAFDVARNMDRRQDAVEKCVRELTERQRELIRLFYGEELSAQAIAKSWDRSVHVIYKCLKVLRRTLLDCVERRLLGRV